MTRSLVLALLLSLVPASAVGYTQQTRDAPWLLTGISRDQQTLRVIYQGSGCLRPDGVPVVDTSVAGRVVVRVRQTVDVPEGPYEACILPLYRYKLAVPLDAPLAGRAVRGGPRFKTVSRAQRMPRVIGLLRMDAVRVLRAQELRITPGGGQRTVVGQTPRPGVRIDSSRRVTLRTS